MEAFLIGLAILGGVSSVITIYEWVSKRKPAQDTAEQTPPE
jgi:hypothetical protein